MALVTLHELSIALNVTVRVLRLRLKRLLADGILVEDRDCRRENYVDETHFVWRVDADAFIRASGNQFRHPSANSSIPDAITAATPRASIIPAGPATPSERLPNFDTANSALQREFIDLLKEQVRVKDRQIGELSLQNKELNDTNLKLVAQTVKQSDRIQTLLQLTEGKIELPVTDIHSGSGPDTADTDLGNRGDIDSRTQKSTSPIVGGKI